MKKYWKMAVIVAVCVFVIDWMIMGIKLIDNDHNILLEAYVAGGCWLIVMSNAVYTAIYRLLNKEPAKAQTLNPSNNRKQKLVVCMEYSLNSASFFAEVCYNIISKY